MGRKKRSKISSSHHDEDNQDIELYSPCNESKKKLFFEDPLLESNQIENISISDVRRITNKTFDFLRNTGLRQTHISATSGINQSILSIILRDPGTKTISLNRKRDIVTKLCDYYKKINEGIISHDPQTAPKMCTRKKMVDTIQQRRKIESCSSTNKGNYFSRSRTTEANFENVEDFKPVCKGTEEPKNNEMDYQNRKLMDQTCTNERSNIMENDLSSESFDKGSHENYYILDFCTKCSNNETSKKRKFLSFKKINIGPISSLISSDCNLEYMDMETLSCIENITPAFKNEDSLFLRWAIAQPLLIPLTINMRHYINNEGNDSVADINSANKSNPIAFISSIKVYKAESFIWCSTSSNELLWGYIESLCRERYLSSLICNKNKKRIFQWLRKEIQYYKNLYLEFLYVIWKSGVHPTSNPSLMCEINLNETHDDVVIIDKFMWNISQSPFLLKKQIGFIVSDIKLPDELYPVLLHSALKQLFSSIVDFLEKSYDKKVDVPMDCTVYDLRKSDSCVVDDTSSVCSGASSVVAKGDLSSDSVEPVSTNKIIKWGDEANLEYDSDDNALIYPIVESATLKRQIENKNRFTKRRT